MSTVERGQILELKEKITKIQKSLGYKQIKYSNGPLSGPVTCCNIFGIDNTTGDLYYKDDSGNWTLSPSGGGGSVSLTTTNTSGPSTLLGSTLNIPDYTQYFTLTKAQLDTAIAGSTLIKGATYKVTGVHSTLYNDGTNSGTTIYVKALETNKISQDGVGEFYNPIYNYAANDFGIWNNISHMTATVPTGGIGVLRPGNIITANNGAVGTLISGFSFNRVFFTVTSGDWTTATSFGNGQATPVTSNVSSPVIRSYTVGGKVIYGGYVWTNLTGNVGSATNVLTLDATNWSKVAYNTTDYELVYNPIIYDYTNNAIVKRTDRYNNIVQHEFSDIAYFNSYASTPINGFQWGNKFCHRNIVYSSLLQSINHMGETESNELYSQSVMAGNLMFHPSAIVEGTNLLLIKNVLRSRSEIRNNTIIEGTFVDRNTLESNSTINGNILYNSARINETFMRNSCQINFNEIRRAVWTGNRLEQACTINSNLSNQNTGHILGNRLFRNSNINSNVLNGLYVQAVASDRAYIFNNNMTTSTINSNTLNVGFNSRGCYINNNVMLGDISADTQIRLSAINSCVINGVTATTYIRMCQLRTSQILSANIDNATNDFRYIDLEDYVWTFSVPSTLSGRIDGVKISRDYMTASFTKTFSNSAGNGALGNIIIPAIQVPQGAYIEEVIVDVTTTLVDDNGGRAYITFGTAVDAPNSGINITNGYVSLLNSGGMTRIMQTTFNKTTAARNLIMAVTDGNLLSGEVKITVKILKTI